MTITETAYAKLNISLDIVSKMSDGYHDMKMVFQTIDVADEISINISDKNLITLDTNAKFLPCDDSNIAIKAAYAFFRESGITGYGAKIKLTKRIPVCAGMGGGSADGAAVLRGLNRFFDSPLSVEQMLKISRELGSDVPFCLIGGTVLGCGRGDIMTELPPLPECYIVVCKPSFSVSTPALFKRIDVNKIKLRPDTEGIIQALEQADINGVARRMYNVFEDVLPNGTDKISEIKGVMYDCNAVGAVMTGTGSATFGIFKNSQDAQCAYNVLSRQFTECFMAKPVRKILG